MSDTFTVSIARWEKFQFLVDFHQNGVLDLLTDETPPLGDGKGPNPMRLVAAAVGSCLSSSLLFCLNKARVDVNDMRCVVEGELERNEKGRLRIRELRVRIEPGIKAADIERIDRCVGLFEDFCIVTESVRAGIKVSVDVAPQAGDRGIVAE